MPALIKNTMAADKNGSVLPNSYIKPENNEPKIMPAALTELKMLEIIPLVLAS